MIVKNLWQQCDKQSFLFDYTYKWVISSLFFSISRRCPMNQAFKKEIGAENPWKLIAFLTLSESRKRQRRETRTKKKDNIKIKE